jgi:SAM-dependent methyltransferase
LIDPGARAFSRTAALYERSRPSYPPEAVDAVLEEFHLSAGDTVVDLGAGTGKWARLLVERGLDVVAVEPIAEMRAELERAVPGATALEGTAEQIPSEDASADAVTAAQAFHWFHLDRALPEIHRVLRSGGGFAAVWNERDRTDPLQQALDEIVAPHRGSYPAGDLEWQRVVAGSDLFEPARELRFEYVHLLDAEGVVERVGSVSWIGALESRERAAVLDSVRDVVAGRPEPIPFRYVTEVFTCRRR